MKTERKVLELQAQAYQDGYIDAIRACARNFTGVANEAIAVVRRDTWANPYRPRSPWVRPEDNNFAPVPIARPTMYGPNQPPPPEPPPASQMRPRPTPGTRPGPEGPKMRPDPEETDHDWWLLPFILGLIALMGVAGWLWPSIVW